MRAGRDGVVRRPMGRLYRGRDEVIEEARPDHVARLVIVDELTHGDAEGFRQAAVDLALDDHRVDARAAVVQRVEAADRRLARVHVQVDDADIGAIGEGEVRRIVIFHRLQSHLLAFRHVRIGGERHLLHGHRLVGRALDAEGVDVPFEVLLGDLEHVGGDLLRLGADLAGGHGAGRPPDGRGARAPGSDPVGRGVGVALLYLDVCGGDAELAGEDLRIGRLVPLALRLGAEAGDRRAGGMDAHLAGIEGGDGADQVAHARRSRADDLGEGRHTDAHQLARLAGLEVLEHLGLLLAELVVADRLHGPLQGGGIVAAVELQAEAGGVGELLRLDQVLHPQLGRVHAELLRQDVDHPLDHVDRLRHPQRAAIGDAPRRLVGVDAVDADEGVGDVIGVGADHE